MLIQPNPRTRRVRLERVRVRDCMHGGILSCPPDAPLGQIAGVMAKHHIHAVMVAAHGNAQLLGVVSDTDLISAAASGEEPCARQIAATETLTISADEALHRAAQLMREHGVSHLVVVDSASGHPCGVLSTLDVAAVLAERLP